MKEIKVETIDGNLNQKKNCRKMNGEYYLIGDNKIKESGHCYKINGRYYKFNTGYIVYDYRVKEYILKKDAKELTFVEEGVVDFDEKNNPIFGAFTSLLPRDFLPVISLNRRYYCINDEILYNNKEIKENLQDGIFYLRSELDSYQFIIPEKCDKNYKFSLPYDSRGITKVASDMYEEYYDNKIEHPILKKYGNLARELSFGLEFETVTGKVPIRICSKLGLIPLRDGSINGLEYVTIPLKDTKGLQTVVDVVKELRKRTTFNSDCALHLHIGNVPRTESFFLALYKILFLIQDDIFGLFPLHKKENYGVKRKHYTKPLPFNDTIMLFDSKITEDNLKENFNILYSFLSMGQHYQNVGNDLTKVKSHPSDPGGNSKWNIVTRYYWVNLIPLLFGNKETIEFRIHTPTYDLNKIFNFMLICFAIINFVKKHEKKILNDFKSYCHTRLSNIIFESYRDKGDYIIEELQNYCDQRQSYFFKKTSIGDIVANEFEFVNKPKYIDWEQKTNFKDSYSKQLFNEEMGNIINIQNQNDIGIGIIDQIHNYFAEANLEIINNIPENPPEVLDNIPEDGVEFEEEEEENHLF